jgi:DNA-binding NarL/FixJ family response regulator
VCTPAQIREDKKIRCVLVHDHVLLRQGVRRLLEDEPDLEVVAEAGNAAEALRKVNEHGPEVVITEAHVFGCAADRIEMLVVHESAHSKVVFLTSQQSGQTGVAASGASHAARGTSAEELVEIVRKAAVPRESMGAEIPNVSEWKLGGGSRRRGLTEREREVLKLLAEGRTVRSAAGVLGLSAKTVDAHKFNLMRKLGIHNKAELVMSAIQMRVVKLPVNF